MIRKKHNELIHGNIYTHTKAEMSENNSAITKHWNEVLRLNQDEVRLKLYSTIVDEYLTMQRISPN